MPPCVGLAVILIKASLLAIGALESFPTAPTLEVCRRVVVLSVERETDIFPEDKVASLTAFEITA